MSSRDDMATFSPTRYTSLPLLAVLADPRTCYYPGIYTSDGGFYDAVNPVTGEVGHRRLVLDQSMIMAALDDALNGGAMQKHFAADPESYAARLYLGAERMSIQ